METYNLTAHELNEKLVKKEITCTEITTDILARIEEVEGTLNSFISIEKERALSTAREVDRLIARGEKVCDLTGIPVAIKDNICTEGVKTTCASRMLENYIPGYDATVIKKLKSCNYIMVGKANMDEFAMGSSNESSYFGLVKNPWDVARVPGGSSGGPAASVAAGEAICALGTDTGGSIRQPASLCGVVGFKPTYGMVSRYGAVAFASSLDQIGPITKDVEDCASMLNVICGYDKKDSTSINMDAPDYKSFLIQDIKGLKIGVPEELMVEGIAPEVKEKVLYVIKLAEDMGAKVEKISIPGLEHALSVYCIISSSEASSNLARFDGVRYGYRNTEAQTLREMYRKTRTEGFGDEVKRRIIIGTYCLSAGYYGAYYEKARKVRTLIINDLKRAFNKFDVLLSPTSPTTAFRIGEKIEDPLTMYLSDICVLPANIAGLPAVSIPAGLSGEGLPIGVQIIGNTLREDNVLKVAYSLEKAIGFDKKPGL
ncbi:MAG: Asp-tRNA(Asn)/Glu-tRNA(Gln) amidotransferase subunit GatA [Actinomycetota bacterium]|nr:Asp-tRNA(Asn)/Glu-tRNA(Gln) amidotransferase subunit GatA [Actinomycetota bacterium]